MILDICADTYKSGAWWMYHDVIKRICHV